MQKVYLVGLVAIIDFFQNYHWICTLLRKLKIIINFWPQVSFFLLSSSNTPQEIRYLSISNKEGIEISKIWNLLMIMLYKVSLFWSILWSHRDSHLKSAILKIQNLLNKNVNFNIFKDSTQFLYYCVGSREKASISLSNPFFLLN